MMSMGVKDAREGIAHLRHVLSANAPEPDKPGKPIDDMGRADIGRQVAAEQLRAEQKADDTRLQQIKDQRIANLARARGAKKAKQETKADA